MSSAVRLSPTANLLRKSRLFALPQALTPPQDPPTSKPVHESNTASLPHPIRASVATPSSSLARGDWGLKRPLPAKKTSESSSKPVIRVNDLDTFEQVTDFESAADHTMTLEKFQQLHMPMSLPMKVGFSNSNTPVHQSPFESHLDNTESSDGLQQPGAKQFRHTGPWLLGQTEAEFQTYLERVRRKKPVLLQQLRENFIARRTAERRKQAQDEGEDLATLKPVTITEKDFQIYLKSLRSNPAALGPAVFELLDLPSPPSIPNTRMRHKYYWSPATKLSSIEYASSGPPRTHPSAGLSYTRSHALLYNHPEYGPQAHQRPVEARILRPKGKFRGKSLKAIAGVAGIAVEDLNSMVFAEQGSPPGVSYFDAFIPGGAKYWVTPIRASVDSNGKICLTSYKASATSKAPYGIDYKLPSSSSIPDVARGSNREVPKLDKLSPNQPRFVTPKEPVDTRQSAQETEGAANSLIRKLSLS